jgi:hypothetical protein
MVRHWQQLLRIIFVSDSSFSVISLIHSKVNVSIPVPDPYPCPMIAPISDSFSPICAHACFYSQGCNQCKCMTWLNVTRHYSLHRNGCNLQTQIAIYNDLLWKFISNSSYFRKIYLRVTSLHPKFYMPIFLWDVESSPNYTEKLIFAGIGTITLVFSSSNSSWINCPTHCNAKRSRRNYQAINEQAASISETTTSLWKLTPLKSSQVKSLHSKSPKQLIPLSTSKNK